MYLLIRKERNSFSLIYFKRLEYDLHAAVISAILLPYLTPSLLQRIEASFLYVCNVVINPYPANTEND